MKIIFKILRLLIRLLLGLIIFLLLIFAIKYISCPIYTFEEGKPFHGDFIYNPYQDMNQDQWHKANFQVQSYAWGGVTSGRGNSDQAIYDLYKSLGYDIIATSDYQKINTWAKDKTGYVSVYEHGYGIHKQHQVLLGSGGVLWKDYPLFQTLSNKQDIINKLRPNNQLVFIAHPHLRDAYPIGDFTKLSNYDGIEVFSNHNTSVFHWDAALSAGNYVTILSNDDAHDITNPDDIGHHCTFINCNTLDQQDILQALKKGNSFGAQIYRPEGESFETKRAKAKNLPILKEVKVTGNNLMIELDSVASEIRIYGQNKKTLGLARNVKQTSYRIKPTDTYIRIEIMFADRTTYFLNPICRYDGNKPGQLPLATINHRATWLLRIIGFATLLFIILNMVILWKRYLRNRINLN